MRCDLVYVGYLSELTKEAWCVCINLFPFASQRVDVFQLSRISVLSDVDYTENVLARENSLLYRACCANLIGAFGSGAFLQIVSESELRCSVISHLSH
jgi:hypothetical protein